MSDSDILAHWQAEFISAVTQFCFARPEHRDSAATNLKQTIITANGQGLLSDESTAEMIRGFGLASD